MFNIGGNKFRLITAIHFNTGLVFILRFMTHAQYDLDNEKWPPNRIAKIDKNVSPNWKPVSGLTARKPGMRRLRFRRRPNRR